jgi:homoserine O-acetyltransferase/O-succinyltransferase
MTRTTRTPAWIARLIIAASATAPAAGPPQDRPAPPELKSFDLGDFRLESGQVLADAKLAYTTRGTLNQARSNAILLPSPYSGDHTSYDFLVGPGKALDPAVDFLIATNQLGNGLSSSPSNTPGVQHGAGFPGLAIRDDVEATHSLVASLGIARLRAVVGFSMGGQQAMQWAVSHPDAMQGVVNLCGSAREYPFGFARLEGAKGAIMGDPTWAGGRYKEPPVGGLQALGLHWVAWAYSPEWWREGRYKAGGGTIEGTVESWKRGFLKEDANDLLCQAAKWQKNDVASTPGMNGDLARALGSIRAKVLLMPSRTDQYFLAADVEAEGKLIPGSRLFVIPSIYGHTAGGGGDPAMAPVLDAQIKEFLGSLGEPR